MLMLCGTIVLNSRWMTKKNKIEAGRIVSGATKLVALYRLYQELGWLKLSERRKLHKLFLFYKMENGLAPDVFSGTDSTPCQGRNLLQFTQCRQFKANPCFVSIILWLISPINNSRLEQTPKF